MCNEATTSKRAASAARRVLPLTFGLRMRTSTWVPNSRTPRYTRLRQGPRTRACRKPLGWVQVLKLGSWGTALSTALQKRGLNSAVPGESTGALNHMRLGPAFFMAPWFERSSIAHWFAAQKNRGRSRKIIQPASTVCLLSQYRRLQFFSPNLGAVMSESR